MSFPIFLFLRGTENIFVWFGRVYFCFPTSLCFHTSHSSHNPPPRPTLTPLLSKHSELGRVAVPCTPRESLSCSSAFGSKPRIYELSLGTPKPTLGWPSISEAGCSQCQEASPSCKALCRTLSLCLSRGGSLKQFWVKKVKATVPALMPGEGYLSSYLCSISDFLLLWRQVNALWRQVK